MKAIDSTQIVLAEYLEGTRRLMEQLFSERFGGGTARIIEAMDLGFPHDVIRIAGGFATGAYVDWKTSVSFVPVDTCVNDCAVSLFEIDKPVSECFSEEHIEWFKSRMEDSTYKLNFHRGNHFIALLTDGERFYLLLHSSANEFKDNLNGLYPVNRNYFHEHTKVFLNEGNKAGLGTLQRDVANTSDRYIRYVDGTEAELFIKMSLSLPAFNETRQEFIASVLLNDHAKILNARTYHHYGMMSTNSVIMGGHIAKEGEIYPLLTSFGKPVYMVRYNALLDSEMRVDAERFVVPHGLGKTDRVTPKLQLDGNQFCLDGIVYADEYGQSLRDHPNLMVREMDKKQLFSNMDEQYEYEVVKTFTQIASWNKKGTFIWKDIGC